MMAWISAERGEIHGVMGENRAGKTTLMSILFGLQARMRADLPVTRLFASVRRSTRWRRA
jgi:ABC-type uncharacterized transport system ATPase subunit